MSKPKLMLLLIVFLSVVVVPFNTNGAGPKIYLGISGISFDYIPFWYAKDFRLYEKYNVDLDMITTGGGTVLAQAVGGIFNDPIVGLTSVLFYVSHRHSVQGPKVVGCPNRPIPSEQFWNRASLMVTATFHCNSGYLI